MPIYLYTLLINDDEFYDIPLTDIPINDKSCMSFILSAINKIKII